MPDLSEIEVTARDGVAIARIGGEIDLSNVDEVLGSLEAAMEDGSPGLVVDLRELEYVDSAGVRLLFQAARTVTGAGGRFVVLTAAGSAALRVLELADAAALFPLAGSEEDAIRLVLG
jgi:anti-sigma B factor antagonist